MKSFEKPTRQQIDTAVQRMRSPEFAAYFFSRLENPLWVAPLRDEGLFKDPPPPVHVEENRVSYPHWPASKYLARMASLAPDEIVQILSEMETDNPSIIGDIVDAALAMPPNTAKQLVPFVSRAAETGTLWIHFKDANDLCVRLADGNEVDASMELADALFAPTFEDGQENLNQRDEYWYKEGLKVVLPVLVKHSADEFLPKLCGWLHISVDAKTNVDSTSGADYSWSWRPAIEEHEQNLDYDFAGAMVGFVRQAFEQAIKDSHMPFDQALTILDQHTWQIFRRIRLHLINEFAELRPDLARQCIMDRGLFDDLYFKHEYAMLVGRHLNLLEDQERETWFGWIDEGPDMADFNNTTEEEQSDRKKYWRFEKLHLVRQHLDAEKEAFYKEMLAKHGEPELADLNMRGGIVKRGHDSPMTVDDLSALSFEEAIDRVISWVPEKRQFMGPDLEGLASTFGQYVGTDPESFSRKAESLISRPAIYVRTFIRQMAEAVKEGKEIDVQCVLKLSHWVLERPLEKHTTPTQGRDVLAVKDWQWTRDEIAQLLKNVCQAKTGDSPRYSLDGLRERIWKMLDKLCKGCSTSYMLRDISKDDPRSRDYLDLSINSPRGKAVEAALEYARWVAGHIHKDEDEEKVFAGGFDAIPEVREMLEWQITNRTVVAMALIGSRLGLIYWLDREWLAQKAGQLFCLEGIEQSLPVTEGWAAWNAFLVRVPPHIEFYKLFKKQFAYAVTQSRNINPDEQGRGKPMNHLGEHLLLLYGRGQVALNDDDSLLRQFLSESHPAIRLHAFGFIGRTLEPDKDVPEDIIKRFMVLWEIYWAGSGTKDAKNDPSAWSFGTWFSCGKFPESWAFEQLEKLVDVNPTPEPDHAIMEQLAAVASVDVARAVNILDQMVQGDREGWRVHGWLDSARKVLELGMKADGSVRVQAEKIINHLGRRGYTNLEDLLHLII